MHRALLLFVLLVAGISLQAQNMVPGYVVMHNGDTLNGYVQMKTFNEGARFISFSDESSTPSRLYAMELVKGYKLSGSSDVYQKWYVKMDMTYLDKWDFSVVNVDSTRWDSVFLKLLYKGKSLSMYTCRDVKERFFIYDNQRMQELIIKYSYPPEFRLPSYEFLARAERRQILAIYRDQLLIYVNQLRDNERLELKASIARYNERDLKRIIIDLDSRLR